MPELLGMPGKATRRSKPSHHSPRSPDFPARIRWHRGIRLFFFPSFLTA